MLELWRYQYKYEGRWYEGYIVSKGGLTRNEVKDIFRNRLTDECGDLRMHRTGHVNRLILSGRTKRIPRAYVSDERTED